MSLEEFMKWMEECNRGREEWNRKREESSQKSEADHLERMKEHKEYMERMDREIDEIRNRPPIPHPTIYPVRSPRLRYKKSLHTSLPVFPDRRMFNRLAANPESHSSENQRPIQSD